MRKMFGVLSLIAILTVSFTAQASPSVNGDPPTVVCDIGYEPMVMDVVIVPTNIEPMNVAEFSVNCTEAKEDLYFVLGNYVVTVDVFSDLPSDYGSRRSTNTDYTFECLKTKITPYSDAHEPVGWCNTKIS